MLHMADGAEADKNLEDLDKLEMDEDLVLAWDAFLDEMGRTCLPGVAEGEAEAAEADKVEVEVAEAEVAEAEGVDETLRSAARPSHPRLLQAGAGGRRAVRGQVLPHHQV